MTIDASTPIINVLKELKFNRPAWTQRMLDEFIKIAEKKCFEYESDGTFNHIINDVFNKAEEKTVSKNVNLCNT